MAPKYFQTKELSDLRHWVKKLKIMGKYIDKQLLHLKIYPLATFTPMDLEDKVAMFHVLPILLTIHKWFAFFV